MLGKKERQELPIESDSVWCGPIVVDEYGAQSVVDLACKPEVLEVMSGNGDRAQVYARDAMAALTAAGLNQWYEKCVRLEAELALRAPSEDTE